MRVYQSLPASLHHGISCWLRISSPRRPQQHAALTGAEFQDSRALLPALSINTLGAARPSRIQPLLCIPNVASDRGHDTCRGACAENEMCARTCVCVSVARTRLTLGHYIAAVAAVVVVVVAVHVPVNFPVAAVAIKLLFIRMFPLVLLCFCICCFVVVAAVAAAAPSGGGGGGGGGSGGGGGGGGAAVVVLVVDAAVAPALLLVCEPNSPPEYPRLSFRC